MTCYDFFFLYIYLIRSLALVYIYMPRLGDFSCNYRFSLPVSHVIPNFFKHITRFCKGISELHMLKMAKILCKSS